MEEFLNRFWVYILENWAEWSAGIIMFVIGVVFKNRFKNWWENRKIKWAIFKSKWKDRWKRFKRWCNAYCNIFTLGKKVIWYENQIIELNKKLQNIMNVIAIEEIRKKFEMEHVNCDNLYETWFDEKGRIKEYVEIDDKTYYRPVSYDLLCLALGKLLPYPRKLTPGEELILSTRLSAPDITVQDILDMQYMVETYNAYHRRKRKYRRDLKKFKKEMSLTDDDALLK